MITVSGIPLEVNIIGGERDDIWFELFDSRDGSSIDDEEVYELVRERFAGELDMIWMEKEIDRAESYYSDWSDQIKYD